MLLSQAVRAVYNPVQEFKSRSNKKYKPLREVLDLCQYYESDSGYLVIKMPTAKTLWAEHNAGKELDASFVCIKLTPESICDLYGRRIRGLAKIARSLGFKGVTLLGKVEITS